MPVSTLFAAICAYQNDVSAGSLASIGPRKGACPLAVQTRTVWSLSNTADTVTVGLPLY